MSHLRIKPLNYTTISIIFFSAIMLPKIQILLDDKLTFNRHIIDISSSAYNKCGFILRNCRGFNTTETGLLFFSLEKIISQN